MSARMINPAFVLPDGMRGIGSVFEAVDAGRIPPELQEIVALRASQINGSSACVYVHNVNLAKAGESVERVAAVAAWRDAPFFDEAERAALELAETVTRLADRSGDAVSDDLWDRLTEYFDEEQMAALMLLIGVTNLVNRLNAAIKEQAGTSWI